MFLKKSTEMYGVHVNIINLLLVTFHVISCHPNLNSAGDDIHSFLYQSAENVCLRRISLNGDESSSSYWIQQAQRTLFNHLLKFPNKNIAKNVILFLGDGMSVPTLAASRIYKGQLEGKRGEESKLFMEDLPYTGFSKTYCVDRQVADSACSATAYLCGVKANFLTIGVSPNVTVNDCTSAENPENHVSSIANWAQSAEKATGIVTTTTVTHASPAGCYAHTPFREYESDADVARLGNKLCQDIASQLIFNETGKNFKVILGGGRAKFLPNTIKDEDGNFGERLDGKNLIKQWFMNKKGARSKYVASRSALNLVDFDKTEYLFGLFTPGHMNFHLDSDGIKEPTLAEMTEAAIRMLRKEPKGYFLFVEGGRIDHGHHYTQARKALDETVEFDKAIKLAREMTSEQDTLIVVTSDHSHTMSIAGYSDRGADILGLNSLPSDVDGLPYTTISYANGPTSNRHANGTIENLTDAEFSNKDYLYPGQVPLQSETHGGDDVAVFASGPWAHLFSGFYEQNVIPHIMAFASCIGPGFTACGLK